MAASPLLHHSFVQAQTGAPSRALLVAHGILGSGANLRGLAQRLVAHDPSWVAVLVDLRGHGRSPALSPPHTVAACAADLRALEPALDWPVEGALGHSFGGKVVLAYHQLRPDLARLSLLDSAPFTRSDRTGSEETMTVIEMLERAPASFESRAQFVEYVYAQGQPRGIGDWLAMNLTRTEEGWRLRTDLDQIRALLDDYFQAELWSVLERSQAWIDLVIGGRSRVWSAADVTRARELSADHRLRVHVLPDAGHWVHVDDPDGVVAALTAPAAP